MLEAPSQLRMRRVPAACRGWGREKPRRKGKQNNEAEKEVTEKKGTREVVEL